MANDRAAPPGDRGAPRAADRRARGARAARARGRGDRGSAARGRLAVVALLATAGLAGAALGALGVLGAGSALALAIGLALGGVALAIAIAPGAPPGPEAPRSARVAEASRALEDRIGALRAEALRHRRAAERAREDREEFLAAVSHELRTPLNSIQGFTQVLLSEIEGPLTPSQREDVEAIRTAGGYLKDLIDEVLDASSRHTPPVARLELVDVGAIVREVAKQLEGRRGDRRVEIEVEVAAGMPRIPADPRRIRQIVQNLGGNAVKFSRAPGRVSLRARADADAVRIAVSDTGPGIAPEDRERVFRAFERVDTNRGRTEGWGLGLAIAREMAQWHAGDIEVESEVGRGSTFTLVLPVKREGGGSA